MDGEPPRSASVTPAGAAVKMILVMEEAALDGLLFGGGGLASSLLDTAAETGTALQPVPCLRGTFCSLHLNFFSLKIIQLIIRL